MYMYTWYVHVYTYHTLYVYMYMYMYMYSTVTVYVMILRHASWISLGHFLCYMYYTCTCTCTWCKFNNLSLYSVYAHQERLTYRTRSNYSNGEY